jgi:hypothetical protein
LVLAWVLVLVCTVSQIMFFKQRDARKILWNFGPLEESSASVRNACDRFFSDDFPLELLLEDLITLSLLLPRNWPCGKSRSVKQRQESYVQGRCAAALQMTKSAWSLHLHWSLTHCLAGHRLRGTYRCGGMGS